MTAPPRSDADLDARLSAPRAETLAALSAVEGDVMVLGAGGKMGPTLTRMVRRAFDQLPGGASRRVIAVSRFGADSASTAQALVDMGVEVVRCDLLDREAVARLPDVPNLLFLAGQKFGTSQAPARTWMLNVLAPAICAERFHGARIVAFSTGNVYPLVSVSLGGSRETDAVGPVGEYAASCLGRERVFENAAATWNTRVAMMRLNYAIALRYGVLTDIALQVRRGEPVPLDMGFVNVIWQGDANAAAIELLAHASTDPLVVNVTGADVLSVRWLAEGLGERLGARPRFTGVEREDALLSDTARMRTLIGPPALAVDTMLDWVAAWVASGAPVLAKPTHFSARDGAF